MAEGTDADGVLPESFEQIVADFTALSQRDRLQLLLEFSQELPPLPEAYAANRDAMEPVVECQSPVFVAVDLDGGPDDGAHVFFDAPREALTTRGFAGILAAGLAGLTAAQVLAVPDDVPGRLGLTEAVSPLRLRGMAGMLARIKRQVRARLGADLPSGALVTVLRLLLPGAAEVGDLYHDTDGTIQALADLYAYPDPMPSRGWVRANMISSLDGAAAGADGRSGSIGGPADRMVFGVLRGLADVVLVGAGTVRTEKYGPPAPKPGFADRRAAAGQAPAACLAIVTRSGQLPEGQELFGSDNPSYVVTTAGADLDALRARAGDQRVIVAGEGDELDLADAVRALAGRGLGRVLLEGGPTVLGLATAAGRVEELCLTWSPAVVGGTAPRIAAGPPAHLQARLAHLISADGLLLSRWLLHDQPND